MSYKRLFLVGFMCSGKSSLGKMLAEELRWTFVDLDREIERAEGMSIPDIFEKKGEEFFRKREFEILKELSQRKKILISTGGGLGANPIAMSFMKSMGLVLWLKVDFETFLRRCGQDISRPLLKKPPKELLELFEKRQKVYQQAHIHLDASLELHAIAQDLLAKLKTLLYNENAGG